MLPLWRDEVVIYFAPNRVALTRVTRGIRSRVVATRHCEVTGGSAGNPSAALACLSNLLTDDQWHGASARLIVADTWVRYGIVPAPVVKLDEDGRLSHARYVLADTFGDSLSDWVITLTDAPPGRTYIACAIPTALHAELEDVLLSVQLKLTSLKPKLVAAFDIWRKNLPFAEYWFVSLDEGSLAAVQITDGEWRRVHTARLGKEWPVELQRLRAIGRYTETSSGGGQLFVDATRSMRVTGMEALSDLTWLEPSTRQEGMPEFDLLQGVTI